jgi:hypothetical protein
MEGSVNLLRLFIERRARLGPAQLFRAVSERRGQAARRNEMGRHAFEREAQLAEIIRD